MTDSLSDVEGVGRTHGFREKWYKESDIKKAVKKLKEEIIEDHGDTDTFEIIDKTFGPKLIDINSTKKVPHKGSSSINIDLSDSAVEVRHGETNEVLYWAKVEEGYWDKLWDAIKDTEDTKNEKKIISEENVNGSFIYRKYSDGTCFIEPIDVQDTLCELDKKIEGLRGNSTHGNCCTCQDCKNYHDDCKCEEIEELERLKDTLQSINAPEENKK